MALPVIRGPACCSEIGLFTFLDGLCSNFIANRLIPESRIKGIRRASSDIEITTYEMENWDISGSARRNGINGKCCHCERRGRRPALLQPWTGLLRRSRLLGLDAGALGLASPSQSLDPRPLRTALKDR